MIHIFGIGVLFAALVQIVLLLFKFANYCQHLKTLWSFITDFQNWVEVPMLVILNARRMRRMVTVLGLCVCVCVCVSVCLLPH